jgi:hypothetical protein
VPFGALLACLWCGSHQGQTRLFLFIFDLHVRGKNKTIVAEGLVCQGHCSGWCLNQLLLFGTTCWAGVGQYPLQHLCAAVGRFRPVPDPVFWALFACCVTCVHLHMSCQCLCQMQLYRCIPIHVAVLRNPIMHYHDFTRLARCHVMLFVVWKGNSTGASTLARVKWCALVASVLCGCVPHARPTTPCSLRPTSHRKPIVPPLFEFFADSCCGVAGQDLCQLSFWSGKRGLRAGLCAWHGLGLAFYVLPCCFHAFLLCHATPCRAKALRLFPLLSTVNVCLLGLAQARALGLSA